VRELENAIEGIVALSTDGEMDLSLLPHHVSPPWSRRGGNRTHAARSLGLNRGTLHSKLQKYGLARPDERDDQLTPEG